MADQGSFLKPTFRRVFLLANRPILEGSDSLAEVFQRAGLDIKVLGYMSGPPQRATSFRTSVAGPPFFSRSPIATPPRIFASFHPEPGCGPKFGDGTPTLPSTGGRARPRLLQAWVSTCSFHPPEEAWCACHSAAHLRPRNWDAHLFCYVLPRAF